MGMNGKVDLDFVRKDSWVSARPGEKQASLCQKSKTALAAALVGADGGSAGATTGADSPKSQQFSPLVRKASVGSMVRKARKSTAGVQDAKVVVADNMAQKQAAVFAGATVCSTLDSRVEKMLDPNSGSYYFYDRTTGKTAWTKNELGS